MIYFQCYVQYQNMYKKNYYKKLANYWTINLCGAATSGATGAPFTAAAE